MLFLQAYLILNSSCFIFNFVESPNWKYNILNYFIIFNKKYEIRPEFRYHNIFNFFGLLLCIFLMLAYKWWWSFTFLGIIMMLFLYIHKNFTQNRISFNTNDDKENNTVDIELQDDEKMILLKDNVIKNHVDSNIKPLFISSFLYVLK